jgi:hypothetical protein
VSSQGQDRVGGAARGPEPDHQEVVVVINHLNRVGKPCLQLRPAAPDPALHLRRELGDEPGQLGFRCHRSHCIGAAQARHRSGRKAEPKRRCRRTDQRQAAQRVHFPSPGISPSSLVEDPLASDRWGDLTGIIGQRHRRWMNELLVGYARVSTEQQDLTAQRNGLHALGVGDDRIYVDHGLTGANRDRPGLRLALAACRAGDTLVVTKLDRLARSLPDARDILDELTTGTSS